MVEEIQKAERWDELKLRVSFNFFLFTIVYLFAKRFFLWEVIYALYYLTVILFKYTMEFLLMPLFQSNSISKPVQGFILMDYLLENVSNWSSSDLHGLLP